ncbi:MAG: hypothetical protein JW846_03025 [Dehalococcoidia bacterium]|nr:hypothetical protein [Dehalococcoidia bacterium]
MAVLADDQSKSDLITLLRAWRSRLDSVRFVATRDTANILHSRLGLDVARVESRARGGACELAALVISGSVSAVLVLREASMQLEGDVMIATLHRVCDIHGVPFASNRATAEAVLNWVVGNATGHSPVDSPWHSNTDIETPSRNERKACQEDMMTIGTK